MKCIIIIFLLIPVIASAQFRRGQVYAGSSFSFQGKEGYAGAPGMNGLYRAFGISPAVGYFLDNKWAIGVNMGYTYVRSSNYYTNLPYHYDEKYEARSLETGIFCRRYFAISGKFLFTIRGGLSYGKSWSSETDVETSIGLGGTGTKQNSTSWSVLSASVGPGFVFFPTPTWGIIASLGTINFFRQQNLSNHLTENNFQLSFSNQLSFGVYYFFKRKP